MFDSVIYDDRKANPWKWNNTADWTRQATFSYLANQTQAQVNTLLGDAYNFQGTTLTGTYAANNSQLHNVLILDLDTTWFNSGSVTDKVFLSYTMECGNDSLKGRTGGGFTLVPDAGSSLLLLMLGLGGLSFTWIRRKV